MHADRAAPAAGFGALPARVAAPRAGPAASPPSRSAESSRSYHASGGGLQGCPRGAAALEDEFWSVPSPRCRRRGLSGSPRPRTPLGLETQAPAGDAPSPCSSTNFVVADVGIEHLQSEGLASRVVPSSRRGSRAGRYRRSRRGAERRRWSRFPTSGAVRESATRLGPRRRLVFRIHWYRRPRLRR